MSFGSYSLGYLGYHVMTFSDCPDAYTELMGVSSDDDDPLHPCLMRLCMIGNPTSQDGIKIQGCLCLKNVIRQRFPFNNATYGEERRNARFTLAAVTAYFSLSLSLFH